MKPITQRGVVALSFAGLVGLGLFSWSMNRADAQPAPAKTASNAPGAPGPARPTVVEVATVSAQDFADELTAVGTLKAAESVVLRPEVSGRIAQIGFRDGAVVNKGDLLIALDATIPDAELVQARANRDLALASFRRNQELVEKKFISQQALDASAAALKVQEAAVQLAQAKAAKLRLRAPFRGIVGLRDVSVGSYIKEGEVLVNLEDISSLKVDFRLAETWLGRLKPSQTLDLASDALPGKRFAATVEAIDPQIDPAARSIAVRARLDNASGQFRPGMFVRVRLALGERKGVLMVPEEAIIPGAKPAVFKVVDGKAERVVVRTGIRRDAQVEIVEGLSAGDVVVSAGQMKLRPGAAVQAAGMKPAAATQGQP